MPGMSPATPQVSLEGMVLDILRCSLHDGPGIRTTVFLKGCPLTCIWCHNAESQARGSVLSFNGEKCTGCGGCAAACQQGCHTISESGHVVERVSCKVCGACVRACPADALEIRGKRMSAEQVLAEVQKDVDFYRETGGGMTISGGEPMQQTAFTTAVAAGARSLGIHVAVETCGLAPTESYRGLLPHVQLFLFDYKDTDPERHQRLTGVSNEIILRNLAALHDAGAAIVLRCPLVPGVNDTSDHLAAIAGMRRRFPRLQGVEVMAYHNMGNEKARRAGVAVRLDQPSADEARKRAWRDYFATVGGGIVVN